MKYLLSNATSKRFWPHCAHSYTTVVRKRNVYEVIVERVMTIFTVEDLVRLRLEVCRFVNAYFQILMKLGLFWLFSLDPIVKLCMGMGESDRKVY